MRYNTDQPRFARWPDFDRPDESWGWVDHRTGKLVHYPPDVDPNTTPEPAALNWQDLRFSERS